MHVYKLGHDQQTPCILHPGIFRPQSQLAAQAKMMPQTKNDHDY